MLIDSQRAQPALPHLQAATALKASSWPVEALLTVHWAEWHSREGRSEKALELHQSILARQEDPENR